ncbi:hypothetical protein M2222_008310 [Bradyrhizobium elkanii]|uniref:hypothetical protein n=1 Tax=Bradyrhizobium elkanii TaxID=29448 RepID=UPI002169210A|nr:hypothetical protein [Bradyrhizobium elkanii]MCS3451913.1 hypothetical protein [Bradyrhizobium elkanii]MCS3565988.1 hypothetical protein [Bradyrhizobium elkanii]MCW2153282.1 hypothetical protein [Bradyrhizobium elkanii]MCW2377015.1 hypothetical protein [Bradyrhizobium elkanii]
MNQIINQFRRIFADDGRGDKDFTQQEERLKKAQNELKEASASLARAANHLADFIKARM